MPKRLDWDAKDRILAEKFFIVGSSHEYSAQTGHLVAQPEIGRKQFETKDEFLNTGRRA